MPQPQQGRNGPAPRAPAGHTCLAPCLHGPTDAGSCGGAHNKAGCPLGKLLLHGPKRQPRRLCSSRDRDVTPAGTRSPEPSSSALRAVLSAACSPCRASRRNHMAPAPWLPPAGSGLGQRQGSRLRRPPAVAAGLSPASRQKGRAGTPRPCLPGGLRSLVRASAPTSQAEPSHLPRSLQNPAGLALLRPLLRPRGSTAAEACA